MLPARSSAGRVIDVAYWAVEYSLSSRFKYSIKHGAQIVIATIYPKDHVVSTLSIAEDNTI